MGAGGAAGYSDYRCSRLLLVADFWVATPLVDLVVGLLVGVGRRFSFALSCSRTLFHSSLRAFINAFSA